MVVLIAGASHTGKTFLAQRLLERYGYPYLSLDLLKMGLIRSGRTELTPEEDGKLVTYLWPVVREIVKTAVENHQNLIVEGVYIPFSWKNDFTEDYLKEIRFFCLVMSRRYIENHFAEIAGFANVIERRLDDSYCSRDLLIRDNEYNREMCAKYGCDSVLIDDKYEMEIEL